MRENPVVGAPVKDVIHKRPLDYEDSWVLRLVHLGVRVNH